MLIVIPLCVCVYSLCGNHNALEEGTGAMTVMTIITTARWSEKRTGRAWPNRRYAN